MKDSVYHESLMRVSFLSYELADFAPISLELFMNVLYQSRMNSRNLSKV